jgi:hypothetical protein
MDPLAPPRAYRYTRSVIEKPPIGRARSYQSAQWLSLVVLLSLAACAETDPVLAVTGPNGTFGWLQISCPTGIDRCRELAARSCPKGYEVVDRRGDASRYTSPSGLDDAAGAPGENGGLLVACK